ncbi:MAG: GAF domain-containing protein [Magnetococcales bacterium]|nr:GAF domain-containing protein [Magnetococcales bacterium]NGZ27451.1 GAF domain-containing protein [Magnetococcales bacterium]
MRQGVQDLLKGFENLFKTTQKLMRMSDRSEQKLKQANIKIQQQQEALEIAHEKLERHAEILEETVRLRTADLVRTQKKLQKLVELGISLSAERDLNKLLENILLGGMDLTFADGGSLYLRTKEETLRFSLVRNNSLKMAMGGSSNTPVTLPEVPLILDGEENHQNIAAHAALSGKTVVIEDAYHEEGFDFSGVKLFDQQTGYCSRSFLTVPLKPRMGRVIGVLQLLNACDPETGEVVAFDPEVVNFVEALAAQAAMTLDNQILLQAQKDLFDAFIRLIAAAIDAKSPYTGGHCERVPELARLLAEAACKSDKATFADFQMNEDELREMHIASWLHDCGKVTTPEYVVDKATKLECIHNRIHEVRTRFEVLHRDAVITYLKGVLANLGTPEELQESLDQHLATLQEEFAFIARCNVGGEFMAAADKERVKQIGSRRWHRYFDDSLGLSHMELKRKKAVNPESSTEETLLSDKLEHIIPRERDTHERDAIMGIRMSCPENLYNMGELYNLCIERGTLTYEERYKINEHVVQTLAMLEQLPFPEGMTRVPEFAGAHHETMIGTGYPRQLKREEMSIPARIMAIADVFEALTATDRPYKEPKTLSQSIKIMSFMKKDGHIDPDLFDIFLQQGVYLSYAHKYLEPFQIDQVDISQYVTHKVS